MKTLKISFLALCFLTLLSCNDRNRKDANTNPYETENTTGVNDKSNINRNTTTDQETLNNNSNYSLNDQNMTSIYKDLDMTQDQIDRFEKDYKENTAAMENVSNNDNSSLNTKRQQQMEESLRNVLSKEQYAKYQQWQKDHQ